MTKKIYTSKQLKIPYEDLLKLRSAGSLNLGMDNSLALQISNIKGAGPKNKGVVAAFHFWAWIGVLVFIYTIYLSFTSDWWWFIVGFIGLSIIWQSNKTSNAENILEEALRDEDFYIKILKIEGWLYEIEEKEAIDYIEAQKDI